MIGRVGPGGKECRKRSGEGSLSTIEKPVRIGYGRRNVLILSDQGNGKDVKIRGECKEKKAVRGSVAMKGY